MPFLTDPCCSIIIGITFIFTFYAFFNARDELYFFYDTRFVYRNYVVRVRQKPYLYNNTKQYYFIERGICAFQDIFCNVI